jgi:hypothetical protein
MRRLIAIPTCHQYVYHDAGAAHSNGVNDLRSSAIRQTWYKTWQRYKDEIDLKFFFGHFPSEATRCPNLDEIFLDVPDNYTNLPAKVQKIFHWALDCGYDYVLKIDDDVFVHVDRLLREFEATDYKGFSCGDFISGAAYWVSRKSMQFIVDTPWPKEEWAEDRWVGKILSANGIYPAMDERFQVCHCDVCIKKFSEESRITLHTNGPKLMYELGKQYGG